jgi:HSP20 family protein
MELIYVYHHRLLIVTTKDHIPVHLIDLEVNPTMLMRTDPFRELDRLAQQVFGTVARPAFMPMDAWRDGDTFHIEFDLPGVRADSIDLDVERNVLTVRADRAALNGEVELIAAERPSGVFSRQLILGDNVDLDKISASYHDGVLSLEVPVAEEAKPRKIAVESVDGQRTIEG